MNMKINKEQDTSVFSRFQYKSKFVDISVTCGRFDDESFKTYPMDCIYNVAKRRGYDNVLFVLAEDVYKKKLTYTPFYTITSEKYIYGLDCDSIEPADYSPIVDNKMIIDKIDSIIVNYMSKTSYDGAPMTLAGYDSDKLVGDRCIENPLKRSILVLFDKPFYPYLNDDLAKKIVSKFIIFYKKQLKKDVHLLVDDAYVGYLCLKQMNDKEHLDFSEYSNNRNEYLSKAEKYLVDDMNVSFINPDYTIEDIDEFKTIDGLESKMPDGTMLKDILASDIDTLINARYNTDISLEAYFGVSSSFKKPILHARKPAPSGMIDIRDYSDKALEDILEKNESYILITYAIDNPDDRVLFMFPDKKILYREYEEIRETEDANNDDKSIAKNRLESVAKMIPNSDDEVMQKAAIFPAYDKLVREIVDGGININNDSIFSKMYGNSYYELCINSVEDQDNM